MSNDWGNNWNNNSDYNPNFERNKNSGDFAYPVHAAKTSGLLERAEPILTPELLVSRFLKGIPLVFPNGDSYTPDDLKDQIMIATNEAEIMTHLTFTREGFKEKLPFDYNLYRSYVHLRSTHGPILSLERLAIVTSDNANIFQIPAEWIDASNFSKNLINVIPLLAAYGVNSVQGAVGNAGIAFLTIMDGLQFVPAYWEIRYTAGVSNTEGQFPVVVNQLIGCFAAINILSDIATSNIFTSQSQSQDGISQSSSGPGPRIYELRIAELTKKRDELIKQIRGQFSTKYLIGEF